MARSSETVICISPLTSEVTALGWSVNGAGLFLRATHEQRPNSSGRRPRFRLCCGGIWLLHATGCAREPAQRTARVAAGFWRVLAPYAFVPMGSRFPLDSGTDTRTTSGFSAILATYALLHSWK